MNSIVSGSLYTVVCNSGWKVVVQVLLMRKFGILSFVLGVKRWQTAIAATASFNGYVIWMVRPLFLCHKWPLCSFSCSLSTKITLMRSKTVKQEIFIYGKTAIARCDTPLNGQIWRLAWLPGLHQRARAFMTVSCRREILCWFFFWSKNCGWLLLMMKVEVFDESSRRQN